MRPNPTGPKARSGRAYLNQPNPPCGTPPAPRADGPPEGRPRGGTQALARALTYLRNARGMTILLVEQYLEFAHELADEFAVMDRGEVVMSGTRETFDADAVRKHMTV